MGNFCLAIFKQTIAAKLLVFGENFLYAVAAFNYKQYSRPGITNISHRRGMHISTLPAHKTGHETNMILVIFAVHAYNQHNKRRIFQANPKTSSILYIDAEFIFRSHMQFAHASCVNYHL